MARLLMAVRSVGDISNFVLLNPNVRSHLLELRLSGATSASDSIRKVNVKRTEMLYHSDAYFNYLMITRMDSGASGCFICQCRTSKLG